MKRENEQYIKLGVTIALAGMAVVLGGFLLNSLGWFALAFARVLGILKPFLYGVAIAYLLSPLCNRLEKFFTRMFPKSRRFPRACSILLSLLFALVLVGAVVMLVLPQVGSSLVSIALSLPGEIDRAVKWAGEYLENNPQVQSLLNEIWAEASQRLQLWLKTDLLPTAQNILGGIGVHAAGILGGTKDLFLGILISVYLLASRQKFALHARMLLCGVLPKHWADLVEEEIRYADKMFNGFLMGKLLDSAIVGVLCFVCTSLFRFKSAALISVIVGVTNIIPFFGPFIGAIPSALLLLLESPSQCLLFLLFIVVLQQLDGNFIGPKILGNTTGLSSFWVLFAILLFGGLWGVMGMILGVPLFAVLYDMARRLIYRGLRHKQRYDLLDGDGEKKE